MRSKLIPGHRERNPEPPGGLGPFLFVVAVVTGLLVAGVYLIFWHAT